MKTKRWFPMDEAEYDMIMKKQAREHLRSKMIFFAVAVAIVGPALWSIWTAGPTGHWWVFGVIGAGIAWGLLSAYNANYLLPGGALMLFAVLPVAYIGASGAIESAAAASSNLTNSTNQSPTPLPGRWGDQEF